MSEVSASLRLVIGASSGIGAAITTHWLSRGHRIVGTFRTESSKTRQLVAQGAELTPCDFSQAASVDRAATFLSSQAAGWEGLALLSGTMLPIGTFETCDFELWADSIRVNFVEQMRLLRMLLPTRSRVCPLGALIVFFSGSGSNSAPASVSAYTISKIALTKMCEFLDTELADARTVIIGPGWVKTKIHEEMLAAGAAAGDGYRRTVEKLERGEFVPVESTLSFLDWLENQSREVVGGRNFSVPNDPWKSPALVGELERDPDMYKLRRFRNEWTP